MAGHFSHLLLPALFHLCLQKWGNFSGYMPYSLAALDETSSLDSHNGTKNVLKVHFNSHTPMISKYIFGIVCHQKKTKTGNFFCVIKAEVSTFTCCNRNVVTPGKLSSGEQLRLFALCALPGFGHITISCRKSQWIYLTLSCHDNFPSRIYHLLFACPKQF